MCVIRGRDREKHAPFQPYMILSGTSNFVFVIVMCNFLGLGFKPGLDSGKMQNVTMFLRMLQSRCLNICNEPVKLIVRKDIIMSDSCCLSCQLLNLQNFDV